MLTLSLLQTENVKHLDEIAKTDTKRKKQFNPEFRQTCRIMGRKSQLKLENEVLMYKPTRNSKFKPTSKFFKDSKTKSCEQLLIQQQNSLKISKRGL